ncbi:MAG TPA: cytochrome c3 family protein [Bacillota bacterium]|nr:cytochrome c3 family protein [Bacillota bacterium]
MKTRFSRIVCICTILLALGTTAAFASPEAYLEYSGQDDPAGTVDLTLHFTPKPEEMAFDRVDYAFRQNSEGSDLDWQPLILTQGTGADRFAVLNNATKYMNYIFRIYSSNRSVVEATYVRAFPVDTQAAGGSSRASNAYGHGNFAKSNELCGACHSTHSALRDKLLVRASYYETCMLCHSNANTQSKYDVEAGQVTVAAGETRPSLAGPFVTGQLSGHNADDTLGITPVSVPGSEQDSSRWLGLTCISCHLPHGGENDNYRLLRKTVFAAGQVYEDDPSFVTKDLGVVAYALTDGPGSGEELFMIRGNTEFCAACHLDYLKGDSLTPGGNYAPDTEGAGAARYRHPVSVGEVTYSVYGNDGMRPIPFTPFTGDVLPLQFNPLQENTSTKCTSVVCSTCHYAHGSTKVFNTFNYQGDSRYMLRLDNYGICESCHKK